jgi:hypothetical protein
VFSVVGLPAEAKRLGGGGSFGRPTQSPSGATGAQRSATPPAPSPPACPSHGTASRPTEKDPRAEHRVCKHVAAVLDMVRKWKTI